jgi:hypothetical protein
MTSMSNKGVFAEWQARYAEQGIATFPVTADKIPAISNWQKVGREGSKKLARKFVRANAFGVPCGFHSGIVVLDIDSLSGRVAAEAFDRHGQTRFIVLTASGYHGYYRYRGERRLIRPYEDLPVDVLGAGFVVAPPSIVAKGRYEIIEGTLDDLANLPPISAVLDHLRAGTAPIPEGKRDDTVFKRLLREVKYCDDFDSLLDKARSINMDCEPPMSDAQIIRKAKQVWKLETTGENWVGRKARASTDRDEILSLSHDPWALMLLQLVRVSFPVPDFTFPIDQVKTAETLGWSRKATRARISTLMQAGHVTRVHYGKGTGDPHLYQLTYRRPK